MPSSNVLVDRSKVSGGQDDLTSAALKALGNETSDRSTVRSSSVNQLLHFAGIQLEQFIGGVFVISIFPGVHIGNWGL